MQAACHQIPSLSKAKTKAGVTLHVVYTMWAEHSIWKAKGLEHITQMGAEPKLPVDH